MESYEVRFRTVDLQQTLNVKSKNPALLSCSARPWLHYKTNRSSLTFKMAEKSGAHGNVKTKNPIMRKTQKKFLINYIFLSRRVSKNLYNVLKSQHITNEL